MSNHYHLLVKTPEGNLGRAMRHINGVYTQRYNRRNKTDGSLFRGRYKAIVIEEDSYQLQVSRYIHLNPLEAGVVAKLEDFTWSSYQYYVSKIKSPNWLYPKEVLQQMGSGTRVKERYRTFTELGIDDEINTFYGKDNIMPYLGSDEFREWAYHQKSTQDNALSEKDKASFRPDMDKIINDAALIMGVTMDSILTGKRGKCNVARWLAMYLCQEVGGHRLITIANKFNLKRSESITTTIRKLKELLVLDKELKRKISQYYT